MSQKDTQEPNAGQEVRRLYGRQKGHSLRPAQAQLVDELLPRLSVPIDQPGLDPRSLFEDVSEVWLEVGFGSGEHMLAQAKANPNVGFIGCEPYLNGVASLLSEIKVQGLSNIRVLRGDARDLLDQLAPNSLDRAFLLFPDPWPKKRRL